MRILYLSHERKMGGANRALYELATAMRDRGHEVYISVLFKNCPLGVECQRAGIKTVPSFFGWWMQPSTWPWYMKAAFRFLHFLEPMAELHLAHFIRTNKIDIVHSNTSTIDMGARLRKRTGVKHVWHIREFGDKDYQLEFMCGRQRAIKYINQGADGIICISAALRKHYGELKCVEIIHDGVLGIEGICDRTRSKIDQRDLDRDKPYTFLIVGNLIPGKNQILAVEAAGLLRQKGITNFKLNIAGPMTAMAESRNYVEEIKGRIEELGLEDYANLLGFVDDMISTRDGADAEIVASRAEGYGRVTIEAMAAGNLVIASDSGANTELLGKISADMIDTTSQLDENPRAKRGLLFRDNDAVSLADAMQYAMTHSEEIGQIERTNLDYIVSNHTTSKAIDKVEELYRRLMS